MGVLLAFPVILILLILQTTLVSQVTLLSGCADLLLLWLAAWGLQKQVKSMWVWTIFAAISIAYISAIPWFVPVICYPVVTLLTRIINKRIWQSPLLMMFLVTIVGSMLMNGFSFIALRFTGVSIPLQTGLIEVIIPSVLINLLLALPIYAIARDMAQWAYPMEAVE